MREIYFWRHLAVRGRTRKYLTLQYTKILQSSTKLRICPRTMGKMGQTNHEAMRKGKHWQALRQGDESLCNLLERPLHWAGERKTPWGKPGECFKHRWGKVRQASRWGPWNFRPSTAYGAFPCILSGSSRVPGHWEAKSSAVPGRHTAVSYLEMREVNVWVSYTFWKLRIRPFQLN